MNIYHGSIEQVTAPEIRLSDRTQDYGNGFYATTSHAQAEKWVRRRIRENKVDVGYVNIYEFDPQTMQTYNTISFSTPTEEWVDFVMANRMQKGFTHDYDIVYGPVANDHVYTAFAQQTGTHCRIAHLYSCRPIFVPHGTGTQQSEIYKSRGG